MEPAPDQRERVREKLKAAGVPTWAPFSPDDGEVPGRYYAWVENGEVHGRLLVALALTVRR